MTLPNRHSLLRTTTAGRSSVSRRRQSRRGVLLLVVLSLLVLFLLAGLSFVMVAGQYRRGTVAISRIERTSDFSANPSAAKKIADTTLDDLIAGSIINENSVVGSHALLRDLYGEDSIRGRFQNEPTPLNNNSIWRVYFAPQDPSIRFKPIQDYYDGRVFTVLTGDYAGRTSRVVDYQFNAGADGGWGNAGQDDDGMNGIDDIGEAGWINTDDVIEMYILPIFASSGDRITNEDEFLINGAPFNGIGVGLARDDTTALSLSLTDPVRNTHNNLPTGYPVAFLPNYGKIPKIPSFVSSGQTEAQLADRIYYGGMDESWDAVDYQNMFLARVPTNYQLPVGVHADSIIPSFHRPSLILDWFSVLRSPGGMLANISPLSDAIEVFEAPYSDKGNMHLSQQQQAELQGLINAMSFRPPTTAKFDGGNPNFSLLPKNLAGGPLAPPAPEYDYQWDIDNDGDGIADSIWIDVDLPIFSNSDGSKYKPLVSVLCVDLDSRLNLNTLGTLVDTSTSPLLDPEVISGFNPADVAGTVTALQPSFGDGYGPAEVSLRTQVPMTPPPPGLRTDYQNLIANRYTSLDPTDELPGLPAADDARSPWKWANTYRSPTNEFGFGATLLSNLGQPIRSFRGPGGVFADATLNDPYEFSPTVRLTSDSPYTDADLETLLRINDPDISLLSQRLPSLTTSIFSDARVAWLFTTRSVDIPYPQMQLNPAQRDYMSTIAAGPDLTPGTFDDIPVNLPSSSLLEYVYLILQDVGGLATDQIAFEAARMLPMELLRGQKFDINRVLGDGVDNNGNGLIDEIEEDVANLPPGHPYFPHVRHHYARQLYCLMMFLRNPLAVDIDFDGDGIAINGETAQAYAQWAVNVVDFRDSDAIMTGFEYDENPYDGWQVDGDLSTDEAIPDRKVVWGCERPELLITETLAWHDRRTEDLATETVDTNEVDLSATSMVPGDIASGNDSSFDQRLRPQGAFFVELYNPSTAYVTGGEAPPKELYYTDGPDPDPAFPALDPTPLETYQGGVVLNQKLPGASPTWRMLVTNSVARDREPNDGGAPLVVPDRQIYFVTSAEVVGDPALNEYPAATEYTASDGSYTSADPSQPTLVVPAGRYAVLGGGQDNPDNPGMGEFVSFAGQRSDAITDSTRKVLMRTNPAPTELSVKVPNNDVTLNAGMRMSDDPTVDDARYNDIPKPVTVVINSPKPLNISEPPNLVGANGYPAYTGTNVYAPPFDRPLDSYGDPLTAQQLLTDGTVANFKTVYLQRLANPLLPWNPLPGQAGYIATNPVNPYITVDQSTVDLTVFNGEQRGEAGTSTVVDDGSGGYAAVPVIDAEYRFASNQRGDTEDRISAEVLANTGLRPNNARFLWMAEPNTPAASSADDAIYLDTADTTPIHRFNYNLKHTLGYLNSPYWPFYNSFAIDGGYVGQPITDETTATGVHPTNPNALFNNNAFPWLTWNDRPFANHLELLQVPKSSSANLLDDFAVNNPNLDPPSWMMDPLFNPYEPDNYSGFPAATDPFDFANANPKGLYWPFKHLLNFFYSPDDPTFAPNHDPPLYPLLDYVEVPSRFEATSTWLDNDPTNSFYGGGQYAAVGYPEGFHAMPTYQDPGRINLNTVIDYQIWNALMANYPEFNTPAKLNEFLLSRQVSIDPLKSIRNPFRSAASGSLMPSLLPSAFGSDYRTAGVQATLLRTDPITPDTPLFVNTNPSPEKNAEENSYFRYLGLTRLGNLTSHNSNVFSVWVTVGYFEVDERGNLGKELGYDSGQITRNRFFYIIDRSIPVPYEPGGGHDASKVIVLQRALQ